MKRFICIYVLSIGFFIHPKLNAQPNLVPNPSFEDTTNCNYWGFYLEDFTANWHGGFGYYNPCQTSSHSVPTNYLGYQIPKSGNAYCGITTRCNGTAPAREYIQTKLLQKLIIGKKYKVSFYVSLADSLRSYTNSIGAYFSVDSFFVSHTSLIDHIPQIQNNANNDLGSKTDWTLVCDTFVATNKESYITIGNFYTDSLCPLTHLTITCEQDPSSYSCCAYYYIDDVSVELVDDTGVIVNEAVTKYKLLPNPNNGMFKLICKSDAQIHYALTSITGQIIEEGTLSPNNGAIDFNKTKLSSGLYTLKVIDEKETVIIKVSIN